MAREETYLGFDFGLRRIGVAVGETVTGAARPLTTLPARDGQPDWDRIAALLAEWRPAAVVVGVPRHDDAAASELTATAERFARRLHGRFGCPVHTVDERLSSRAAEQALAGSGRRTRRDKGEIDRLAAAIILETWLAEKPDERAGERR